MKEKRDGNEKGKKNEKTKRKEKTEERFWNLLVKKSISCSILL